MHDQTFIYVISAPDGARKIGVAKHPDKRLRGLQTGHPGRLTLSSTVQVGAREAYPVETETHRFLASHAKQGEWFDVALEIAQETIEQSIKTVRARPRRASLLSEDDGKRVFINPWLKRDIYRWIRQNAKRPNISAALWAELFCHLRMDTGEIVMTRKEMAEAAGTTPDHVSSALSELVEVGALIRHQEGREVRWFMNPNVGTCLTGKAREDAQKAAPKLSVVP
jgi:DNA-binding transcriptional ArsR family regulator